MLSIARSVCPSSATSVSLRAHKIPAVWGVIWLIQAFVFFAAGIIIGIVAFKVRSSWCSVPLRTFR